MFFVFLLKMRTQMFFNRFLSASIFIFSLLVSINSNADESNAGSLAKFFEYTEDSKLQMDFSVVDQLLHAGVLNMGPSTRAYAQRSSASLGTRLKQSIDGATENEANRFFYENLQKDQEKILNLRKQLEAIPNITPLSQYTKEAQLAYWLNLYSVTLINELAVIYPLNNLRPVLTGGASILDEKLLVVDNTSLSLNDIHYRVLPFLYPDNLLYIYGVHQGIKGSPNIRGKAYTASNVKKSLLDNAREFVNSNRGTQFNGGAGVVRVSSFYERNASLFQDFENDIKSHLLKYADGSVDEFIKSASTFKADINNWHITDLYGSIRRRDYGVNINGMRLAKSNKFSMEQRNLLVALMRVRAINFGEGTVSVTDLPSNEETTTEKEDNKESQ
ncbi:MAG: hypothetical protein ACJAYN_000753 [Bermanella sp.]|jgi:hypothetical protein